MTSRFLTFTMLFLFPMLIKAHALWIETAPQGKIGQEHEVKIYFGELAYGMYEEVGGDSFNKMKNFKLYLIDSDGNKSQLSVAPRSDHYIATFTPEQDDLYTLSLDNNDIPVIDFTKYDFGIFKTHYHASATVVVGNGMGNAVSMNSTGLSITPQPSHNGTRTFKATYKDKPIAKAEVNIAMPGGWSKTMTTDKNGFFHFTTPFDTPYYIEITKKEETTGVFKGEEYEFVWHAATYMITKL